MESAALSQSTNQTNQPNQATVFRLRLDQPASVIAAARSLLSRDELARADRFVVESPRTQFVLCRAALRLLIAEQLGCQPTEVRFQTSSLGKPLVAGGDSSVQFNVSHSGDFGLIAISNETVGVDIEKLQPRINAKSLVSQVVSADELTRWNQLPASSHAEQIIRLWVCKEAVLKALGLGIAECLRQISLPLPIGSKDTLQLSRIDPAVQIHLEESSDCRCNAWLSTSFWKIQPLAVHPEYYAAVVTTLSCWKIELEDFQFEP